GIEPLGPVDEDQGEHYLFAGG
uniref:Sphingopyxin I n=1 Tax=Sphingopyxis alaskensis (strain DSM 13593 / LMG 18877 / RB2256) TaxID=317655 RepID=A0A1D5B387_SPHAL|nr:Chain A, Sphingopyxin I [Sphingopyxis alaskensis RB2256]5JQF_B Chain B, Sphingopyxin I [Sphingopyxis alaskensis RB2256]